MAVLLFGRGSFALPCPSSCSAGCMLCCSLCFAFHACVVVRVLGLCFWLWLFRVQCFCFVMGLGASFFSGFAGVLCSVVCVCFLHSSSG